MSIQYDSSMANQLRGPADLCPAVPEIATSEQSIRLWLDLMETCDQLLLAGLRREIGPDGDLKAAYRRWRAKDREERDRALFQLIENFNRRARS
jgi:hypothetical protein